MNTYMEEDLAVMMKFRRQCICGFNCNQKLSSQMESEGLWTTQGALEEGVIMTRNDAPCTCHTLLFMGVCNKTTFIFDFALHIHTYIHKGKILSVFCPCLSSDSYSYGYVLMSGSDCQKHYLVTKQTYASLGIAALTFGDKELPLSSSIAKILICPSRTYHVHSRYI